jgi:hypothetical protein
VLSINFDVGDVIFEYIGAVSLFINVKSTAVARDFEKRERRDNKPRGRYPCRIRSRDRSMIEERKEREVERKRKRASQRQGSC